MKFGDDWEAGFRSFHFFDLGRRFLLWRFLLCFMAMFDWNEEELTDIISGEARESDDDHIVPYPDQNEENHLVLSGDPTKREMNHETTYASHIERKKPCMNTEHGVEVVGTCKYDIHPPSKGFSNSWTDGLDTAIANLEKDTTGQIDKVSDFLQNTSEDREQGDFVDYGWANIGSFDDLDIIFRNNDPICGVMSGGNVDESWFSSEGVTSGTSILTPKSGDSSDLPLGALNSLDGSEIGAEFTLDSSHSFVSVHEMFNEIKSDARHDEQGNNRKRLLKHKCNKSEGNNEIRRLHDLGSACSSQASLSQQFSIHYAPSTVNQYPPLVRCQQWQFQKAEPFQQKQFTGPLLSSTLYGNVFHYPPMPIIPQFHPVEGNHDLGNANSPNKSMDSAVKPPTMTPKEKIEKLRRRQKLRAILAIQKQQQQFSSHSSVEHSTMEGENKEVDENVSNLPSLDHSTSTEVNDSSTVSIPSDNCSVEESVLYQLQETISKLDIQIRLCIRDSLFRLAQSAIQRQCPSDMGSVNSIDEVLSNKDIDTRERFNRISDVEIDTNPIDRTVAHLLFHRPLELSGKLAEKHDSPVSANLSHERKPRALKNLGKGHFPESFEKARVKSPHGSKTLHVYFDKDQSKDRPCLDTLQNLSTSEAAESGLKCL